MEPFSYLEINHAYVTLTLDVYSNTTTVQRNQTQKTAAEMNIPAEIVNKVSVCFHLTLIPPTGSGTGIMAANSQSD